MSGTRGSGLGARRSSLVKENFNQVGLSPSFECISEHRAPSTELRIADPESRAPAPNQHGIALIVVLWMLALLTIMAGAYNATMRTETISTARQLQTSQARALAEAGVWLGLNEILKPQAERHWRADNSPNIVEFGAGSVEIRLQDQAGKIDLNSARVEILNQLIKSAGSETGIDDTRAAELADAILDWRDRDNLKHINGAEDSDYQAAGMDYGAKDAPFNSVSELRQVLGMTTEIFSAMEPLLTVHTHQAGINPLFASREALLALPGIAENAIDEYLTSRGGDSPALDQAAFPGTDRRFLVNQKDQVVEITTVGSHADAKAGLSVILQLKRGVKPPFSVLSWREI